MVHLLEHVTNKRHNLRLLMLEKDITKLLATVASFEFDNKMVIRERGLETEFLADASVVSLLPDGTAKILSDGDKHPSHPEIDNELDASHEGVLLREKIFSHLGISR